MRLLFVFLSYLVYNQAVGYPHKLIYLKDVQEWRLYDLENDPMEIDNLSGKELPIENTLNDKLLEWINR